MDAALKTLELAQDAPRRSMQRLVRHLDLFSGIGGFALAAKWVGGIETVAFCERDEWAWSVLRKNFPGVPIHPDVKTLNGDEYGRIDLITGGYPCQPFSVAGKQRGKNDDRHLWPEVRRIVERARPRWLLCENVAGHIELGLDEVLSELESIGYSGRATVIPACAVDARHRRDRVWIVANANGERGYRLCERSLMECAKPSHQVQSGNRWASEDWGHCRGAATPETPRVADGLPGSVDRNRGLGNAIVPQVAAEILRAMMAVDCMSNKALSDFS